MKSTNSYIDPWFLDQPRASLCELEDELRAVAGGIHAIERKRC